MLGTANLPTNVVDFRGFDSSIVLIYRGGIPRCIRDFPESLSQAILVLVGIMLVGRLGVWNIYGVRQPPYKENILAHFWHSAIPPASKKPDSRITLVGLVGITLVGIT